MDALRSNLSALASSAAASMGQGAGALTGPLLQQYVGRAVDAVQAQLAKLPKALELNGTPSSGCRDCRVRVSLTD